ncbi:hypothetical protein ACHAXT_002864 [Thalassiosira profunda]
MPTATNIPRQGAAAPARASAQKKRPAAAWFNTNFSLPSNMPTATNIPHQGAAVPTWASAAQKKRPAAAAAEAPPAKKSALPQLGPGKRSKLFAHALLNNGERDELHSEIYMYFKWLECTLTENKLGRTASSAGMSITSIKDVVNAMESGLRHVGDDVLVLNGVARHLADDNRPPFLEQNCKDELRKRRAETRDKVRAGKGETKSWDDRYLDLLRNIDLLEGHTYREMNARMYGLGDWVQHQRRLYERCDEKFIREKAPRLAAIPGFKWKQPKQIQRKKPKPNPAAMLASMPQPPPMALAAAPLFGAPLVIKPVPPPPGVQMSNKYLFQPAVLYSQPNGLPPNAAVAAPPAATKVAEESQPKKKVKRRRPKAPPTFDFDTEFENLRAFAGENGHMNPARTSRLGKWIDQLRKRWIAMGGELDPDATVTTKEYLMKMCHSEKVASWTNHTVEAPPGKLGLTVVFSDRVVGEGAEVKEVADACPFHDAVNPGDFLIKISDTEVSKAEDLAVGADETRTITLARKTMVQNPLTERLTDEQVTRLTEIGFSFNQQRGGTSVRLWEDSFDDMMTYYKEHGDMAIPRTYTTATGYRLGEWVHNQRGNYRKKNAAFMRDKAPRLEEVGFLWEPQNDKFKLRFKELIAYKKAFGHVDVPCNNGNNNEHRNLGRWVANLRYTKKRLDAMERGDIKIERKEGQRGGQTCDYLTKQRIKLLEDVGFKWEGEHLRKAALRRSIEKTAKFGYANDPAQTFSQRYHAVRAYLDALAKPVGSLGSLEDYAARIAALQRSATPKIAKAACLIFAGDHGVAKDKSEGGENCSSYPQAVSRKVLEGLDHGVAGASVLARCNDVALRVIDVGLADGPTAYEWKSDVVRSSEKSVKGGTKNFCKGFAMTEAEVSRCLVVGLEETHAFIMETKADVIVFGEVGIGNTTTSSALIAALTEEDADSLCGTGASTTRDGINDEVVNKKVAIVKEAMERHWPAKGQISPARAALASVGGAEIVAMVGGMLEAADQDIPVLVDGFIVTTAAMIACMMDSKVARVLLFATQSTERGQAAALAKIDEIAKANDIPPPAAPTLNMNLRMGEATGALMAVPLARSACAIVSELATLDEVLGIKM